MHAARPLPGDDTALDRLYHQERQKKRDRRPDRGLPEQGDAEPEIYLDHHRHDDVAEQDDDDIGRKIIRLVPVQSFAAMAAYRRRLEEAVEYPAFPARRATISQPTQQSGAPRSMRSDGSERRGHARPIGPQGFRCNGNAQ